MTELAPTKSEARQEPARRHWIEIADVPWGYVFLIVTLLALASTDTSYTSRLAEGQHLPYFYPFLWEFTGHYAMLPLLPLIVLAFGRISIGRQNWYWTIPVHLAISVGIGAVHTLLMWGTRRELYRLLGLGTYNYGDMPYRFWMEYHKQLLVYWLFYGALRLLVYYRETRAREREAAALKLKTSELQRQLAQVQLQALRSQLNPHFLFNTLNMVSSVMYEDVDRADHMLAALSRMLRLSLEENAGEQVPVRREMEFVNCAMELIQARFKDRVNVDIHCSPEAMDELVPNLLVYTLIENAVKHHDLEREKTIRIQVRIERNGEALAIQVLDNGPGIADVDRAMHGGVGLSNTKQRLHALYGENHRFEILNRPEGGLQVRVAVPLANGV
jgi:signal transduction histidine kinase